MKEFDYKLENVYTGIHAEKIIRKRTVSLKECHNLEPLNHDYRLHEFVVDADTDDYNWGNA